LATISNTPRPGYVYDSTDAVWYPIGTGTHSHSEIASTIVDAKGDIIAASAADTPARLAVGNNGETLVADSSQTTGLAYREDYAAGKNKIINGDFNINQRSFSSTTTDGTYGFDRWAGLFAGGTTTYSAQTFTAGTAPVAGYEAKNYARIVTTSQSANDHFASLTQKIEDVRNFAGQTVTFSFWAKAATGTPNIGVAFSQFFGFGGSPSAEVITSTSVKTITSSWARYSFTVAVPSLSGKTVGTNANTSFIQAWIFTSAGTTISALGYPTVGLQNVTIDIWGVQVEDGSVATAFQTATGTLQGELAACQRYYYRNTDPAGVEYMATGQAMSTTIVDNLFTVPVTMRTDPTTLETSNMAVYASGATRSGGTFTLHYAGPNTTTIRYTHGSAVFTNGNAAFLLGSSTAPSYVGLSAEL
jgi:hypothetical protein